MTITTKFKQSLKAKAHKLRPIVMIGNKGFTKECQVEIERGLVDHELIKIQIQGADRDARKELYKAICETVQAEAVQLMGGVATIYRKRQ